MKLELDLSNVKKLPSYMDDLPRVIEVCLSRHYKDFDVVEESLPKKVTAKLRGIAHFQLKKRRQMYYDYKESASMPMGFNWEHLPDGAIIRVIKEES